MNANPAHFAVWDVVRVEFPYADKGRTRGRPALVVATPASGKDFAILWVLMITSARHTKWDHDVLVSGLTQAGLSRPCFVRTGKIATLDARHAVRIGELATQDRIGVKAGLRELLRDTLVEQGS